MQTARVDWCLICRPVIPTSSVPIGTISHILPINFNWISVATYSDIDELMHQIDGLFV